MKIEHKKGSYSSGGGKLVFKKEYDYCLYRQDFGGTESVYFNADEFCDVNEK